MEESLVAASAPMTRLSHRANAALVGPPAISCKYWTVAAIAQLGATPWASTSALVTKSHSHVPTAALQ
jgi:hypothetical protein